MTAKTTTQLTLSRGQRLRHFMRRQDRWRLVSVLLVALVLVGGSVREALRERGQVAPEQPIIILATPALPSLPTATPSVPSPAYQVASSSVLRTGACAVIGYGAPSLDAQIGAIEPQRPYTPTERIGDEWLQAQVAHSGLIWLRPIELACLASVPDIATPIPPAAPPAPAVLMVAPMVAERVAPPTLAPPPPTAAPLPTAPPTAELRCGPSGWCRRPNDGPKRPTTEQGAWESVDHVTPAMEGAP
jgi:hypothetical protein